jgi:prevent-host-death family protein
MECVMKNLESAKTIGAAKFKAECLGLMDEVKRKRTRIVITKNGEPVAQLVPMPESSGDNPLADLYVGGEILGDIISPFVSLEDYEALR